MKDRTVILIIILAIFSLYLLGDYLGITGDVVSRFCEDSDHGINTYMPGHVTSDLGRFSDRCNTGEKSVKEYYCAEGRLGGNYQVGNRFVECGIGYFCLRDVRGTDDACVKE